MATGVSTLTIRPRKSAIPATCASCRARGIRSSSLLKNPFVTRESDDSMMHHEWSGARMRGPFVDQGGLFSYVAPEARVPANHPLRKIRELVRDVLSELNRSLGRLYASEGRPSIPPEQLLSALLLQVFYSIRSERQLMEQLDYNLLYRWFVGLSPDDPVWDPTTFTKNRDRLQNGEVFTKFMTRLLNHPQVKPLLSDEHFSVDGTLIEAWASQKSFRPKDGSGDEDGGANFHGQQRKNDTQLLYAGSLVGLGCCGEAGAATREGQMARVLFVGQQPETVDFTSPMLPPGMNAERIHAGIALALKQMAERGWHADLCLLRPDATAGADV